MDRDGGDAVELDGALAPEPDNLRTNPAAATEQIWLPPLPRQSGQRRREQVAADVDRDDDVTIQSVSALGPTLCPWQLFPLSAGCARSRSSSLKNVVGLTRSIAN
jgi:hypothetical protein